jgi:hypothetical protein
VLTGATRELGRADWLPAKMPEAMGHRLNKGPGVGRGCALCPPASPFQGEPRSKRCRPGYRGTSEERRTSRWAVGSLSGA